MKAKIKQGHHLLFTKGESNNWKKLKDHMIINFNDKYSFISFKQRRNHLLIDTTQGLVDVVFCGETPNLTFSHYEKDQLVLLVEKRDC